MVTKLTLEYHGAHFAGWARQPGLRTVQEELQRALSTILAQPIPLTVAGRTDRGVHAWGQVASYPHEAVDPRRLNALLPEDVAVLAAEPMPEGFDARRHASSRTYCYRVLARPARGVFERDRSLWWPRPVDLEALRACAAALVGTHDFTAFTPTHTHHVRFQRDVLRAEWRTAGAQAHDPRAGASHAEGDGGEGQLLEFWIQADTFMRHMNRILVGTMLQVAGGRRSLADFQALLEGRPRAEAGPTAPAHGLTLASVEYGAGDQAATLGVSTLI
ncbi:MAG TPA: tRNA pseudouridine(38-40) synthase TruA [Solirubrobacteraceae bacterium]|nr:tRNA pseudouridine(38-40) synthase TruA [Solirubrobacteraceae bacterium]